MSTIPSILDDAKFRHLVLQDLNNILTGTSGPLPAGTNTIGNVNVIGFTIPAYNDVVMAYANAGFPTKPTTITFKFNGTTVYILLLTYDANGAATRVVEG
jgi:hypothetical protein